MIKFGFIDPLYIVQAETELKDKLSNYLIEYKKHNEIVVIPNNRFKLIESVFNDICKKYTGHSESFKDKIDILTKEI